MRKWIGALMLLVPFITFLVYVSLRMQWETILGLLIALGITAYVMFAGYLLTD